MDDHTIASRRPAGVNADSVVGAKTLVTGINLQSPRLSPGEVELLQALSDRHQDYIRHGRGREAHAMATAMLIVWRKFCEPDATLERPHLLQARR